MQFELPGAVVARGVVLLMLDRDLACENIQRERPLRAVVDLKARG